MAAFVYIMANDAKFTYVGVTTNLERRVWEHKTHFNEGHTKRYNITQLVYIAQFDRIDEAIAWEKSLKGKSRARKIGLIEQANPRWNDLAWDWYPGDPAIAQSSTPPST